MCPPSGAASPHLRAYHMYDFDGRLACRAIHPTTRRAIVEGAHEMTSLSISSTAAPTWLLHARNACSSGSSTVVAGIFQGTGGRQGQNGSDRDVWFEKGLTILASTPESTLGGDERAPAASLVCRPTTDRRHDTPCRASGGVGRKEHTKMSIDPPSPIRWVATAGGTKAAACIVGGE